MLRDSQRHFISAPLLKPYADYLPIGDDIKEYILLKDYVIHWQRGDVEFKIVVPANFNTDFGTTPGKIFNESYMLPGYIAHDWIYYEHTNTVDKPWYFYIKDPKTKEWEPAIADWSKADADGLMQDLHIYHKAPWWKHSLVYRSVRLFGKPYWES